MVMISIHRERKAYRLGVGRISSTVFATLVGAAIALACSGGPDAPNARVAGGDSSLFVVSSPQTPGGLRDAAGGSARSDGGTAQSDVVYVALPPGSIPNAGLVTIRVQPTGATVTVNAVDGGLDPVAVPATLGDTLYIAVQVSGHPVPVRNIMPIGKHGRPVVIRTSPPTQKRDVPLNTNVIVVFSEPILPASVTSSSVQLTSATGQISAQLAFADSTHLMSTLTPDAPLSPNTDYTLTIAQSIEDFAGQTLVAPVTATFTTMAVTAPAPGVATVYHLTGTVVDDAGTPLPGARLYLSSLTSLAPGTMYLQTAATSDSTGGFAADVPAIAGSMNGPPGMTGAIAFLFAEMPGTPRADSLVLQAYDFDYRYVVASATSNLQIRLNRRREIAVGDSTTVVISPTDAICVNNVQDMHPWPTEWVCATIHVLSAKDGQLTITATPTDTSVAAPALEAEPEDWSNVYFSIYPASGTLTLPVTAGMPQRVQIEVPWGTPRSLSFTVKTTLAVP